MKGLTNVAPAFAASTAWLTEKHSVTFVLMPRPASTFVAFVQVALILHAQRLRFEFRVQPLLDFL